MSMKRSGHQNCEGAALFLALGYLVVITLLATVVLKGVNRSMDASKADERRLAARSLAEGGIEKALATLRRDAKYRGERHTALGDGQFTVEVAAAGDGAFAIRSVGELTDGNLVLYGHEVTAHARIRAGRVTQIQWDHEREQRGVRFDE